MISLDFDWQTNEFMLYCVISKLREQVCLYLFYIIDLLCE